MSSFSIDPADFPAAMAAKLDDPRATICSAAFLFLEALRERKAQPMPDVAQTCALVSALTSHEALVIRSDEIAGLRDAAPLTAQPEDGALVIFSDFSFLWFGRDDLLSEAEFNLETEGLSWPAIFPAGQGIEALAASAAFEDSFGSASRWTASLPGSETLFAEGATELLGEILCQLEDLWDPFVKSYADLDGERNWIDEDEEALNDLVATILFGLRADFRMDVNILSAWKDTPHEIEIFPESGDDNNPDEAGIVGAAFEILQILGDLDRFEGAQWEPNGGPSDRLSGYDLNPVYVIAHAFDPDDPGISNHQRVQAPEKLRRLLAKKNLSSGRINALLEHS